MELYYPRILRRLEVLSVACWNYCQLQECLHVHRCTCRKQPSMSGTYMCLMAQGTCLCRLLDPGRSGNCAARKIDLGAPCCLVVWELLLIC